MDPHLWVDAILGWALGYVRWATHVMRRMKTILPLKIQNTVLIAMQKSDHINMFTKVTPSCLGFQKPQGQFNSLDNLKGQFTQ